MATKPAVKKTPAKKTPAKAVKQPVKPPKQDEPMHSMPMEVKEWIDQATSRMRSLQAKIDRLELENIALKSYKKWAEHRILGSSHE
jgi:hypothetical protein